MRIRSAAPRSGDDDHEDDVGYGDDREIDPFTARGLIFVFTAAGRRLEDKDERDREDEHEHDSLWLWFVFR